MPLSYFLKTLSRNMAFKRRLKFYKKKFDPTFVNNFFFQKNPHTGNIFCLPGSTVMIKHDDVQNMTWYDQSDSYLPWYDCSFTASTSAIHTHTNAHTHTHTHTHTTHTPHTHVIKLNFKWITERFFPIFERVPKVKHDKENYMESLKKIYPWGGGGGGKRVDHGI